MSEMVERVAPNASHAQVNALGAQLVRQGYSLGRAGSLVIEMLDACGYDLTILEDRPPRSTPSQCPNP